METEAVDLKALGYAPTTKIPEVLQAIMPIHGGGR
jgi:hypothetical protein